MDHPSRNKSSRARRLAASLLLLTLTATTVVPAVHSGTLLGSKVGGTVGTVLDVTNGLIAALPIRVPGLPMPSRVTTTVNGTTGGVAQCGRIRVVVPPGAYYGNANITIYVPDGTTLACDLSISPPSANGFNVPVRLEMDAAGTSEPGTLLVGYFDPELGKWTRVPTSVDNPNTRMVSASLYHFSKYGCIPGRAGW